MADTYRGLTVRIGADTTKLTKALGAANGAISTTQNQLRRLTAAMKIDPENNIARNLQLGVVGDQATALASKVATLKQSLQETGNIKFGGKSVSELAANTENAALAARNASKAYSDVVSQLSSYDTAITNMNKTRAQSAKDSAVEDIKKQLDAAKAALEELKAAGETTGEPYKKAREEVSRLKEALKEAKSEPLDFVKVDTTDNSLGEIKKHLDEAVASEQIAKDEADKWYSEMERLKGVFPEVKEDLDMKSTVASYKDLQVELESISSKVLEANQKFVDLKREASSVKTNMPEVSTEMKTLDAALDTAVNKFKALDKAYKMDPKNITLAQQRFKALADVEEIAKKKAELIGAAIKKYDSKLIDAVAKGTRNFSLEAEKAAKNFLNAKNEVSRIDGELDKARVAAQNLETAGETTGKKYKDACADVDRLEKELDEARSAADRLERELDEATQGKELEGLFQQRYDTGNISRSLTEVGNEATSTGKDIAAAAATAATAIGNLMQRAGRYVLDASVEIDEAYRNMRKTVDGTEEQYSRLKDAAVEYSKTHVTSAAQMLEFEALGGQLGITVDKLENFAETAANLDVATDLGGEDLALKLGQLINIMDDLEADNVNQFADSLVRLGNNEPAVESSIVDVTQRIAGQANILKMSTPDVLAFATAIAATGQRSESAGTALSKTMASIEAAVSSGTDGFSDFERTMGITADGLRDLWNLTEGHEGAIDLVGDLSQNEDALNMFAALTDQTAEEFAYAFENNSEKATLSVISSMEEAKQSLDGFAKVAGMSRDEFAELWNTDAAGALTKIIEGLHNISAEGGSVTGVLADLGITAVRQRQGLEGLSQSYETLVKSQGEARDAWVNGGDAAEEAARKAEGISGAVARAQNSLKALADEWGDALTPLIKDGTGFIQNLTNAISAMPKDAKGSLVGISTGFVGLSVAIPIIKPLTSGVFDLGKALLGLKEVDGVTSIEGGLLGAFMKHPYAVTIGAVASALGIFAISAAKAAEEDKKFGDALMNMRTRAADAAGMLREGAREADDYSTKLNLAKVSSDNVRESIESHDQAMQDIASTSGDTIRMLGEYKSVIDELGGREDISAGQKAKLEWAVRNLNEALGTSFELEDVMKGKYEDETGAIKDTIAEIDKLIEKRQQEARSAAYQDMYSEAMKNQVEQERNYLRAVAELEDRRKSLNTGEYVPSLSEAGSVENWLDAIKNSGLWHSQDVQDYVAAVRDANVALRDSRRETEGLERMMVSAGEAEANVGDKMVSWTSKFSSALENTSFDAADLADAMRELHVKSSALNEVEYEDFVNALTEADGDVGKLAQNLANLDSVKAHISVEYSELVGANGEVYVWDGTELYDKKSEVTVEGVHVLVGATGAIWRYDSASLDNKWTEIHVDDLDLQVADEHRIEWNGAEFVWKDTGVTVDDDEFLRFEQHIPIWNGTQLVWKDTGITVEPGNFYDVWGTMYEWDGFQLKDQTGNVLVKVNEVPAAIESVENLEAHDGREVEVNLTGNVANGEAKQRADDLFGAIENIKKMDGTTANVGVNVTGASELRTVLNMINGIPKATTSTVSLRSQLPFANGAIVKHAEGAIYTRPTLINGHDLIAEAGKEAYLPLDNKRATQPLADQIADSVSHALGTSSANVNRNVYIGDVLIPENTKLHSLIDEALDEYARIAN